LEASYRARRWAIENEDKKTAVFESKKRRIEPALKAA
jgi:hypothetical protein